ncbi:magnesium transporter CorA family protein [Candidatus Calescamantes bacterium]|nr:magnesium transporter CorA family protein [Candidatus Calescamantes bacterium]
MIRIFRTKEGILKELQKPEENCWIYVVNPSQSELEKLSKELSLPLHFLTYPLDIDERPRIDYEDGCLLLVIRVPQYDEDNEEVQYTTLPMGIILKENFILTISSRENEVLSAFLEGKVKGFSTAKRARFILQIFHQTALSYLNHLKMINRKTSMVERELHKSMRNEELIKLLNLEKGLVFFTTSLRANEIMMERLQRGEIIKMYEEDKDLLEDVIIENRQAIEMANIYSNILSGMMDAFASVISNNLNMVMKFLTSVTIILMLPTLVASVYGMNIKLPFQNSPHAFLITMLISVGLSVVGILLFIRRKWF